MGRTRPRPALRLGLSLSLRTSIELVALAAIGLGFWRLAEQSRPPGPAIRALTRGDEGARVAALRNLGLMGADGLDAVPALVVAAREDPSPVARRGAAHALMRLAIVDDAIGLPIDATLAGPDPNAPGGTALAPAPAPGPRPGSTPPLLRPRSDEAAAILAEVMRADPDPGVRLYALRCLRKILETASTEREFARARRTPGRPPAEHPGSGPWAEAAARDLAARALDPDPEVAGHAIGFLVNSVSGGLLPDPVRLAALLSPIERAATPLPPEIELMALNGAARLVDPKHPDAPRLVELLVRRLGTPPSLDPGPDAAGLPEEGRRREAAREGVALLLWHLFGSVDDLGGRPEVAEALAPMLSSGWNERRRDAGIRSAESIYQSNRVRASRSYERRLTSEGSTYGGPRLPSLHASVGRAIMRDPGVIGLLWPRTDRPGRHAWLLGPHWQVRSRGDASWEQIFSLLADPGVRPELPPAECEAILVTHLDEIEDGVDNPPPSHPERREVERRRVRAGADAFAPSPEDAALELRRGRELAMLCYFARGAPAGSGAVDRLAGQLAGLLASEDELVRQEAARLLGSLGPGARSAADGLRAVAADDPDESARAAAAAALGRIEAGPGGER